ncbi:hypothetical protein ABZ957_30495 [Streptomyces sp. NPDC046316]|uniref:hypothetical protein n=1 Tax=Streptomyces sp. NPDC046316 TaxID=3154494 RepID=UPI0033FD84C3
MDRRLIQTAVFGSPDSDEPALCPETPDELEAFRREHTGVTIWCGTQFEGGCGRQLTTRLCTDKICHFAHYGSGGTGDPCGRKDRGKDDANHLFAKAHLTSWLRNQGIEAEFTLPEPLGSAVVVHLPDGRTILLHLDRNQPVTWDAVRWETILGPGVQDAHALIQRGYLHRVRFADRPGSGRVLQFGTELHGRGTGPWDALDDIVLTPAGLVSKTRPASGTPAPAPRPMQAPAGREIVTITRTAARDPRRTDPVHELLRHLDIDHDSPRKIKEVIEAIPRLLETDLHPDDANRLRVALPKCLRRLETHAQRRQKVVQQLREKPTEALYYVAVGLLEDDPDASQEEKDVVAALTVRMEEARAAQEAARRAAIERAREEKRRVEQEQRDAWFEEMAASREAMEQQTAARRVVIAERVAQAREQRPQPDRQAHAGKVAQLAPAVRGALKKAAREHRVTTWPELRDKTGLRQLGRLDHSDKVELLALVEADTTPEAPLLSTLLVADDDSDSLNLHRDISRLLGRPLPSSDTDLIDQLAHDRTQLHNQR